MYLVSSKTSEFLNGSSSSIKNSSLFELLSEPMSSLLFLAPPSESLCIVSSCWSAISLKCLFSISISWLLNCSFMLKCLPDCSFEFKLDKLLFMRQLSSLGMHFVFALKLSKRSKLLLAIDLASGDVLSASSALVINVVLEPACESFNLLVINWELYVAFKQPVGLSRCPLFNVNSIASIQMLPIFSEGARNIK